MTVRELFTLARQAELRMARLYEHMARRFDSDARLARLLNTLSTQERGHADIAAQALAGSAVPEAAVPLEPRAFTAVINAIDDVEDEVCTRALGAADAAEIINHLENSLAERFYSVIPAGVPGLDYDALNRLRRACEAHGEEIRRFLSAFKGNA